MAIPPFPSQDLAKLVLGYLAEEQLMTAYDEFLQASPYLDALRNEYDRIFMTSLKNILAEYRAVKIFVETCKPFVLRKKLVQCTNLLDVVQFLVVNIDVAKIQAQDVTDKTSQKQSTSTTRHNTCEVCTSINLVSCACRTKQSNSSIHTSGNIQTTSLENSVETTSLEDLPGNHVTTRKKHVKVLDKETTLLESNSNISNSLTTNSRHSSGAVSNSTKEHSSTNIVNTNITQIKSSESLTSVGLNSIVKVTNTPECRDKIEEFNNVLNKVCKDKSSVESRLSIGTEQVDNRTSNTTTFQDFASGVCGQENRNAPVPDSSTSENSNFQNTKENRNTTCTNASNLMKVSKRESTNVEAYNYPRIKPHPTEQKIKILSDIKVDNPFHTNNNATSTPLMRTIVINGTQAYRQKSPLPNSNYTKDEIMAMPTIIVVPASGQTKTFTQSQPVVSQKLNHIPKPVSSARMLGPLVIDVSSSPVSKQTVISLQKASSEAGLVKTVDVTRNASVPKDNTVTYAAETNTPQVLPPVRKSSSTPRRNSHIRVLDFTTPRRIFHETINEQPSSETNDKPIEVILNRSPNIAYADAEKNEYVDMSTIKVHKIESSNIIQNVAPKKDEIRNKKNNWDADLRALAISNESNVEPLEKAKAKSKNNKKKVEESQNQKKKVKDVAEVKPAKKKKILSPKSKKPKRRRKVDEDEDDDDDSVKIIEGDMTAPVKPAINIIPCEKYGNQATKKENDSNQHKSNDDDANETPEAERISLQNVIGAKLNISELLETPYKQALYDIQMETPKFLGSDLPDEPVSDIKIMNIPTPRFFDDPRGVQATPSSYSSRPTDYSSGGSYYKPDDQDYIPIPDIDCPVTSSKSELIVGATKNTDNNCKKTRPVRQCTKNVSYVNSSTVNNKIKEKDVVDKIEISSSCSDSTVANNSFEKKTVSAKTPKNKSKSQPKTDTKKKIGSSKKHKSPMKKTNSFMKIKPRRPTPTKVSHMGSKQVSKRKSDMSQNLLKSQLKKKSNGKEKNIHITPIITCAPTKSRRKSSTPRKLHCTKTFNSESSGHDSPEINATNIKENIARDQGLAIASSLDSDTEQMALRWSDDGSQDAKQHNEKPNDIEDISKIQAYIDTTVHNKPNYSDGTGALHVDLMKRGFDAETAKIIERDLLDTPPHPEQHNAPCHVEIIEPIKDDSLNKSLETDTIVNNLHIDQDADIEEDSIELSVHECNEESNNYFTECHDDTKDPYVGDPIKLKDKFSMEVCIDDGVTIRLRANDLSFLIDNGPSNIAELGYSYRETEVAVSSITNIDKLYTPLKDQMKATCYEIFDSTLTSLDTPLKQRSPKEKEHEVGEVEIVEEDKLEDKEQSDSKKRKRLQSNSPEQTVNDSKKSKSEAQYLLNSTNIQNIDIESVLKKLHGP